MPHEQEVGGEGELCRKRMDTKKDTCHNEIGSCAQNIDIILGSIFDMIVCVCVRVCVFFRKEGKLCDWLKRHTIVTLTFITFAS